MSGTKQSVIVPYDAAMDLVLAAKYAAGICRRAVEAWKLSESAKPMFRQAAEKIEKALEAWRNSRTTIPSESPYEGCWSCGLPAAGSMRLKDSPKISYCLDCISEVHDFLDAVCKDLRRIRKHVREKEKVG